MRTIPLAAAAVVVFSAPALAQIPVTDGAVLGQNIQTYIQQGLQLKHELQTDLNTATSAAQELQTYLAFVNSPSLAAAAGLINRTGLGNDLPVDPQQVASLVGGFSSMSAGGGGLSGALSKLRMISGYAGRSYATNHVYTCDGIDPACTDMNARSNGIAGSMGLTQAVYADLVSHVGIIQALRDDLNAETDPAKRETIIAHLSAEQVWTSNLQGSLTAASQQAALQQQSMAQRTLERQRQSADAMFDGTQSVNATDTAPAVPALFSAN